MHNQELLPLAARGQLLAELYQNALSDLLSSLGPWQWEADMIDSRISFVSSADQSNRVDTHLELIASIAPGPRTLLWGWAHPQGSPDGLAATIRDSGSAGLETEALPFPDDIADMEAWIAEQAHLVGYVATAVAGRGPYYSTPIDGGTRAVFFLDLTLPRPTVADFAKRLPSILDNGLLDARTSIWFAAQQLGWNLAWSDEQFSGVELGDATATSTLTFDEQGRISNAQAKIGAQLGTGTIPQA